MNGNDYLIIEEERQEEILNDYKESIKSIDEVPRDYVIHWIDNYLSDNHQDNYLQNGRDEQDLQDWESKREDI